MSYTVVINITSSSYNGNVALCLQHTSRTHFRMMTELSIPFTLIATLLTVIVHCNIMLVFDDVSRGISESWNNHRCYIHM